MSIMYFSDPLSNQLQEAIFNGNLNQVEEIIANGYNLNCLNFGVLSYAIQRKNLEIIKLLLDNGADVNFESRDGLVPLCVAIYRNCMIEIIELLIKRGANVNRIGKGSSFTRKWNPLSWAIMNYNVKVVRLLLENGADVSTANENGTNAKTLAVQWNRIELLAQENSEGLNRSDELVQVAKIRKLNKNVITTGRFDRNETALLTAAILSGKLDEAKVLLEKGTDSCKADSNQQTPLLAAVRSKSLEAVRLLLHYGANLTIPTAFLEAINLNCSEIVKYFIENGADVNKQYRDGFTPLTKAIDNGNVKIVKELLNSGAEVNLANDEGETPLEIAANKRSIFIVYLLVEKGADMDLAREYLKEFAEVDEDFDNYYQNLQMNNSY